MKTIMLPLAMLLALLTLLCISCTPPTPSGDSDIVEIAASVEDTKSYSKFLNWTANWKSDGASFMNSNLTEFFTMPGIDLTEVMGTNGAVDARFYLGLEHAVSDTIHLIVVGVDKYGNDMLDYAKSQYAYDVTKPCPIICQGGNGYPSNPH